MRYGSFELYDTAGAPISGNARFTYRGYIISCSTYGTGDIAVLDEDGKVLKAGFLPSIKGIDHAKRHIGRLIAREEK